MFRNSAICNDITPPIFTEYINYMRGRVHTFDYGCIIKVCGIRAHTKPCTCMRGMYTRTHEALHRNAGVRMQGGRPWRGPAPQENYNIRVHHLIIIPVFYYRITISGDYKRDIGVCQPWVL